MKFTVMRASFNENDFNDFASGILTGKFPLSDFKDFGKVSKVSEWDGKDAEPPKEDL
jgi:hypothetical protein